jgi:hypothetical protein
MNSKLAIPCSCVGRPSGWDLSGGSRGGSHTKRCLPRFQMELCHNRRPESVDLALDSDLPEEPVSNGPIGATCPVTGAALGDVQTGLAILALASGTIAVAGTISAAARRYNREGSMLIVLFSCLTPYAAIIGWLAPRLCDYSRVSYQPLAIRRSDPARGGVARSPPKKRSDRLPERVGRGLQTLTHIGQFSRRLLNPLLLDVRALHLAVCALATR